MKPRLIVEADAGRADERHLLDELGVEAELARQRRLLLERRRDCQLRRRRCGRMQVAGHPREAAVDLVVADDRVDLRDRRKARVPYRLRMVAAETLRPDPAGACR